MFKKDNLKQYLNLPFYCFVALALVGLIVGSVMWGGYGHPEVFICFVISYPCTVALYWGLALISNAKWKAQTAFLISTIVRLMAVAAGIGFPYLYLYLTNNSNYYLFVAPIVLLLGYIIAIVAKIKEK